MYNVIIIKVVFDVSIIDEGTYLFVKNTKYPRWLSWQTTSIYVENLLWESKLHWPSAKSQRDWNLKLGSDESIWQRNLLCHSVLIIMILLALTHNYPNLLIILHLLSSSWNLIKHLMYVNIFVLENIYNLYNTK